MYDVLSYTSVNLLVFVLYLIAQGMFMDLLKLNG